MLDTISAIRAMSKDIRSNFKTGVWDGYSRSEEKRTISQTMSAKSALDSMSHIRRIEDSLMTLWDGTYGAGAFAKVIKVMQGGRGRCEEAAEEGAIPSNIASH